MAQGEEDVPDAGLLKAASRPLGLDHPVEHGGPQYAEALFRDGSHERLPVAEMMIGSRVTHARSASDPPQRQAREPVGLDGPEGRVQQGSAEVAVMVRLPRVRLGGHERS